MLRRRITLPAAALLASALLSGCAGSLGMLHGRTPAPQPVDPAVAAARALTARLDLVHRFAQATPTEQAQILSTVKQGYELAPSTPTKELDYALVLAAPGYAGSNPSLAKQLLSNALDSQPALSPSEHALAAMVLRELNARLDLVAKIVRIKKQLSLDQHEQAQQAKHRIQAQIEENQRLRHDLARAQAKLKAITNIERSLNQRKGAQQGKAQ